MLAMEHTLSCMLLNTWGQILFLGSLHDDNDTYAVFSSCFHWYILSVCFLYFSYSVYIPCQQYQLRQTREM